MEPTLAGQSRSVSAYYAASVEEFIAADADTILGRLAAANDFSLEGDQRNAWQEETELLRTALSGFDGYILLEFDVPRLGSRIDAVLISGPAVVPMEFKCGESVFHRAAYNQAWDYALDLKNFHEASHAAPIFPILIATKAESGDKQWEPAHADGVRPPFRCNGSNLAAAIRSALMHAKGDDLRGLTWGASPYHPSPTIIEAAQALYARHSVDAISRNDAGARNLRVTSRRVEDVIDEARKNGEKAVVFVTGVPGAGKTLVGLNVATRRRRTSEPTHAVFLSGNGPLVKVLQEALALDEVARKRSQGERFRKGEARQLVKPFIQNVHHFRDEGVRNTADAPHDHVVIFDEAQRAWNLDKTTDFMKRKKGVAEFNRSEADFLLSYMDRHEEWAVVICLVGGGQEINTGEAGITAWLEAIAENFGHWHVYVSPDLSDSEYRAANALAALPSGTRVERDKDLHLSVSMRSFRSEKVSAFVKAALDLDQSQARDTLHMVNRRYPIRLTRDLNAAKKWIRQSARGSERFGLVSSSNAYRLKPHAIDIRHEVNPVHWFLAGPDDTRSSYYLEDAATEFQVQGLELDWICMTWDADLRVVDGSWSFHSFRGRGWQQIRKPERQQYQLNAYRVLLTRARQGMVIFVPPGESSDPTRLPEFYDETYGYLSALGLEHI